MAAGAGCCGVGLMVGGWANMVAGDAVGPGDVLVRLNKGEQAA